MKITPETKFTLPIAILDAVGDKLKAWKVNRLKRMFQDRTQRFNAGKLDMAGLLAGYELKGDKKCRHCWGRGYTGVERETGAGAPCLCAQVWWKGERLS